MNSHVEQTIRQIQKSQMGGARAAGGYTPVGGDPYANPANPNAFPNSGSPNGKSYTTSLLPMGRFSAPVGLSSFTVTPKCGIFIAKKMSFPTNLADAFAVLSVTIGVKEFLQISTTSGVAAVEQSVEERTFVETGVDIFFETMEITSVCPATISIVNHDVVAKIHSGAFIGVWACCPWDANR